MEKCKFFDKTFAKYLDFYKFEVKFSILKVVLIYYAQQW